MKTYTAVILTLIFLCLAAIALFLANLIQKDKNMAATDTKQTIVVQETTQAKENDDEDSENENSEQMEVEKIDGAVTGKLCYPSEVLPTMTIYLKDVDSDGVLTKNTQINEANYEFLDVPEGTYVAYAYPQGQSELGGGYTQAVPCGLTVECTDHSLIEIPVAADETVSGVDICDWYGAEIPEKE